MSLSTPLGIYTVANQEWALDFVHDAVASGLSIRMHGVLTLLASERQAGFAINAVDALVVQLLAFTT